MSSRSSESYMLIIEQLMAEKDRLIMEKDELVASKDRLWREMQQMLQEKNERIEELSAKCTSADHITLGEAENEALREEVCRLQRRNLYLEEALREALETGEEDNDEIIETDNLSTLLGVSVNRATNFEEPSTGSFPAYSSGITATEHRQLHTPASPDTSIDNIECILVRSRPPTSVKIFPVIESSSFNHHSYAEIKLLAPGLLNSVLDLLKALGDNRRFSTFSSEGRNGCIERELTSHNGTSWSLTKPGCFVCKTCFNHRRPCMRVVGAHEWLLLPLAPDVRDPEATWKDEAYYVYQGIGSNLSFPDVWELSKSAASRRATKVATAGQTLE